MGVFKKNNKQYDFFDRSYKNGITARVEPANILYLAGLKKLKDISSASPYRKAVNLFPITNRQHFRRRSPI
jgi:hypothetical protein